MKSRIFILLFIFPLLKTYAEQRKVTFITPDIVRVQYTVGDKFEGNNTGACVYTSSGVETKHTIDDNLEVFSSEHLVVVYSKKADEYLFMTSEKNSGNTLMDAFLTVKVKADGNVYQEKITYDEKSAHVEETANGKVTVRDIIKRDTIGRSNRYIASFVAPDEKAVYGLGSQMEDYMNLKGKTLYLTQHNLKVHIPVLVSHKGYGLLFDAGCAMKYSSESTPEFPDHSYSMQLEGAKELDFYVICSPTDNRNEAMTDVVAGYRYLTGNVSMMPRYMFGYTQSKERYTSSADLINTLKEYRRRHVPIDMIVQDWNYWPQGWGYMKMDAKYYPDPKALADSIHAMNAKLMVSIWPNPQWCPEADDFKQRGMMLPNDVYDVFNPEARKHYWKYANDEFFSRGFDAWWCDSSEPLDGDWNSPPAPEGGVPYSWNSHERRWHLNKDILSESLGLERSSLYSLYHSMGIYENQRAENQRAEHIKDTSPSGRMGGAKRVLNLTRSSFAGQQRYGTVVWNGDTHASWESFRQQIPSGLNYMATGNPYWTVDVGSFFTRNDGRRWFYTGEFPQGVKDDAYKEYYVRMFQWATFLPMLRSHGSDTPREIWQFMTEEEKLSNCTLSDCKYSGAILKMIKLRYQHIPYIYSLAAMQSNVIPSDGRRSTTMARPLGFDYPEESNLLDIKDEYMFGDFLVCPVTHPMNETTVRRVYLPMSKTLSDVVCIEDWYDYWTGKVYSGGDSIDCQIDIDHLPLFVRSGSIIPTTEVAEYTAAQIGKPVTINVYPGNDAVFTLYEDEGDNYNFEQGKFSTIQFTWNDSKKTLTIGERKGDFEGMLQSRKFIVRVVGSNYSDKQIKYKGKKHNIKF